MPKKRKKYKRPDKAVKLPSGKLTREKLEPLLNDRQFRYAHNYVLCRNRKQAAIDAGYPATKNIVQRASRVHNHIIVKAYIALIEEDYEKVVGISKMMQLSEYKTIAYTNITDLYINWFQVKQMDDLTEKQKAVIKGIDVKIEYMLEDVLDKEGNVIRQKRVPIKFLRLTFHDKTEALRRIDTLMGYDAPSKLEVTSEIRPDTVASIREAFGFNNISREEQEKANKKSKKKRNK